MTEDEFADLVKGLLDAEGWDVYRYGDTIEAASAEHEVTFTLEIAQQFS